nr:response regulator transcription factor [Flexivirga oryzae]
MVYAEDNFLVREGVRRLIDGSDALEVVAACGGFDEALEAIEEHAPDVVLTDIRMPPNHSDEGIRIAEHCRRTHPGMGVLLLSQYAEPGYVKVLLRDGTDRRGYLLKERVASLSDLTSAIGAVASGGTAIDPKVVEVLVQVRSRSDDAGLARLTPRERQVLAAIAQGHTNAAVAAELVLSQHAVEKHINSIFAKLGLTGDTRQHPRVRAALLFLADGGH